MWYLLRRREVERVVEVVVVGGKRRARVREVSWRREGG